MEKSFNSESLDTLKKLQSKFLENPESLKTLIDKVPYAVFIVDSYKKILFFNKKAEEITGYKAKEVVDQECFISKQCNVCSMFDEFSEDSRCVKEAIFIKKNNEEVVFEKSSYPILNPYGEPIAAIEFFIDKTKEAKVQNKLEATESKLSTSIYFNKLLTNNISEGIIRIDKGYNLNFFSEKAKLLTRHKNKKLEGKKAYNVFSKENWKRIKEIIDSYCKLDNTNKKENTFFISLEINNVYLDLRITPILESNNICNSAAIFIRPSLKKINLQSLEDKSTINYYGMISKSLKMKKIFNLIENLKTSNVNVLIEGRSGTGKELIAKALYKSNIRYSKIFQTINCATLSPELLESELFGHKKGSFTGAISDKDGKFKLADNGTIFLDEIGEMPINLQAKLLRVLQFQEFDPVGSNTSIKVNVRIIAATNRNLQEEIKKGKFREDLYYRLKVIPIYLPNLTQRKEDIPDLIDFFIEKMNKEQATNKSISNSAKELLANYTWNGNIRELENLVSYLFIVTYKEVIESNDLPEYLINSLKADSKKRNIVTSDKPEKDLIIELLEKFDFNQNEVSKELNIHRSTLWRKIKKYNIKILE